MLLGFDNIKEKDFIFSDGDTDTESSFEFLPELITMIKRTDKFHFYLLEDIYIENYKYKTKFEGYKDEYKGNLFGFEYFIFETFSIGLETEILIFGNLKEKYNGKKVQDTTNFKFSLDGIEPSLSMKYYF